MMLLKYVLFVLPGFIHLSGCGEALEPADASTSTEIVLDTKTETIQMEAMVEVLESDLLVLKEVEQANGDVALMATNLAYCPLTVNVEFPELENMVIDVTLPHLAVVPARATDFKVLTISQAPDVRSGYLTYRFSFDYYTGDILNGRHDDNFVYRLPYPKGKSYLIGQGYGGRFSHKNLNCLDFNMPVGSEVCAARGGTVIRVKSDSNNGCKSPKCQRQANFIVIYHEDGSLARYIHLQHKGSKVKPGQIVKRGEVIGYSGNTGWSSGPHLHFEVNLPQKGKSKTIQTRFKTANGEQALMEGETYLRN